jgi:hypothetical protein
MGAGGATPTSPAPSNASPLTPPASIPADAAPFDQSVADQVPPYGSKGDKTTGVLVLPDGRALPPQDSGYAGPASRMPKPRRGMDLFLMAHVEAHTVASMREHDVREGTLYINREPCQYVGPQGRPWGCERALPHMLRPGETLTVYGPHGYVRVFRGLPR